MSTSEPSAVVTSTWDYDELRRCLTNERLSSCFSESDGTVEGAFELYEWNMRTSAAVTELTSMVEVIVRNAIDAALTQWVDVRNPGASWLDVAPLDRRARADIARARERATRRGKDA